MLYCIHVFGQIHLNKQTKHYKIEILPVQAEVSCSNTNGEQQDFLNVVLFKMTYIKLI